MHNMVKSSLKGGYYDRDVACGSAKSTFSLGCLTILRDEIKNGETDQQVLVP